jgi:hypothetical protein
MSQQLARAALVHAEGVDEVATPPRAPAGGGPVARKLAMILHAMWRDGSEFRFGQAHRQMRKTRRHSRRVGPTSKIVTKTRIAFC